MESLNFPIEFNLWLKIIYLFCLLLETKARTSLFCQRMLSTLGVNFISFQVMELLKDGEVAKL